LGSICGAGETSMYLMLDTGTISRHPSISAMMLSDSRAFLTVLASSAGSLPARLG
jgi:hypothetical protein